MKLYHYIHCPFCVRVRMALGWLQIPFESVVLPYHDEATPLRLTGVKMLPIMQINDLNQNESLNIIKKLDQANTLSLELLDNPTRLNEVEEWLTQLGSPIHNLCMPYWVWTPEFDEQSRKYFITKKSAKRGPFEDLMSKQEEYLLDLNTKLMNLESQIGPFYGNHQTMTIFDIMIASHLWGMTIHPEFQFSEKVWQYLMRIKKLCEFDYHHDYKSSVFFRSLEIN